MKVHCYVFVSGVLLVTLKCDLNDHMSIFFTMMNSK